MRARCLLRHPMAHSDKHVMSSLPLACRGVGCAGCGHAGKKMEGFPAEAEEVLLMLERVNEAQRLAALVRTRRHCPLLHSTVAVC